MEQALYDMVVPEESTAATEDTAVNDDNDDYERYDPYARYDRYERYERYDDYGITAASRDHHDYDHCISESQQLKRQRTRCVEDKHEHEHEHTILKERFQMYWTQTPDEELYMRGIAVFELMETNTQKKLLLTLTREDERHEFMVLKDIVQQFEQYL